MAQRRNLELKALDPDPARTLEAAQALGADDRGELLQRDTYFHAVQGRLKLREAPPDPAELVAYTRPDRREESVSHYQRVQVFDPEALTQALAATLGVRTVVEKRRRLLLWRDVRIHLDAVKDLGTFVELEALADAGGIEPARDQLSEARKALEIDDANLLAQSYADLLERFSPRP